MKGLNSAPSQLINLTVDFVGRSFCHEDVLGPFVRVLVKSPLFTPERFAPQEGDWRPFDEEETVGFADGTPSGCLLLLDRRKRVKYEAYLRQLASGGATIDVDGKTKPKDWGLVFELGDRLASVYRPAVGWVHTMPRREYPLKTRLEMRRHLMDASTYGDRYRDWGPGGLGMRTYLGPRIVGLFDRKLLLSTPGVVQELPWGGVRIDLVPEPWTACDEALVEAWDRAMAHLAPAKIFATGRVNRDGAADLVRGERFPKEWMDEPGRS